MAAKILTPAQIRDIVGHRLVSGFTATEVQKLLRAQVEQDHINVGKLIIERFKQTLPSHLFYDGETDKN